MKYKSLLVITLLLFNASVKSKDYRPQFEGNGKYIKASSGSFCGIFEIKPKNSTDIVTLTSYVYDSDKDQGKKIGYLDTLPTSGRKFVYDSAGKKPDSHYKIFCSVRKNKADSSKEINCNDVVIVNSIRHRVKCLPEAISGVGMDLSEGYKDLKMHQG